MNERYYLCRKMYGAWQRNAHTYVSCLPWDMCGYSKIHKRKGEISWHEKKKASVKI